MVYRCVDTMDMFIRLAPVFILMSAIQCLKVDDAFTPDLLRGVVEILDDQHKVGGYFQQAFSTYGDCIKGCRDETYCLAVDFSMEQGACWFHDYTTACRPASPEKGVKHIQLSNCLTGVSVAGGQLVNTLMTEPACVSSCKILLTCYGVDYNVKAQSCYHHYMATICTAKQADPDSVHYTRVNCRSSPNAVQVLAGHYVAGGTVTKAGFSEGDCTTSCVHDPDCNAVDYYALNHTCISHTSHTACDPRFPRVGVSHFQFKACTPEAATVENTFHGQVTYDDGTPVGMLMPLAGDGLSCIDLCHMTVDCVAVDWNAVNQSCYFLSSNVGCNSVTPVPNVVHYELIDCKMSGDVKALHEGFHVLGGTLKQEYTTRDRCIDKCVQPACQAVDWDEPDGACYHHTSKTTCNVLIAKSGCTHHKFSLCPVPQRKILELRNATRLPGELTSTLVVDAQACIEMCGANTVCYSADFNKQTMECILHGLHDSCRTAVQVPGWFSYIFAQCSEVTPGAVNISDAHVPGATFVQMATSPDECVRKCQRVASCVAADFNSLTSECYLHDDKTACEAVIHKAGCTHFRLTDCRVSVIFTMQNVAVQGGALEPKARSEIQCYKACKDQHYCTAFDYNTPIKECRLHTAKTGCDMIEDNVSWAHHKLYKCHNLPQSTVTNTVYDERVMGGMLVSSHLQGPVACLDKCFLSQVSGMQACLAVNYDFVTDECWFLYEANVCNQLIPQANVAHYKLYNCETKTIPYADKLYDYPSHRRMLEAGSPSAQILTKQECIAGCLAHGPCEGADYKESDNMCQFHYSLNDCGVLIPDPTVVHYTFNDCQGKNVIAKDVKSNYTLPSGSTRQVTSQVECVASCTGSCFALSYNSVSNACVQYTKTESCETPVSSVGSKLYIITDCESEIGTGLVTATFAASKWEGGQTVSVATTKVECLSACADSPMCTAFSFNYRLNGCFLHETVGCAPILQGEASHDFILSLTTRTQCDAADVFIVQSYGKFHQAGAMLVGQFEQDKCLLLCKDTDRCISVDYNSANFACWFHGADSCGNTLVRDARINHFNVKKCPATNNLN